MESDTEIYAEMDRLSREWTDLYNKQRLEDHKAAVPREFNKDLSVLRVKYPKSAAVYDAVEKWVDVLLSGKIYTGLYLSGPVRTGKTTLAYAILSRVFQDHRDVLMRPIPDLLADIKQSWEPRDEGPSEKNILEALFKVDLLCLDDLGAEHAGEWATERLYRIIDSRWTCRHATIVTSNASLDALAKHFGTDTGTRLMRRLQDMLHEIKLPGKLKKS